VCTTEHTDPACFCGLKHDPACYCRLVYLQSMRMKQEQNDAQDNDEKPSVSE